MYYIIFRGDNYYPSAGLHDMVDDTFKTVEECREELNKNKFWDWYQIVLVCIDGLQVVESSHC